MAKRHAAAEAAAAKAQAALARAASDLAANHRHLRGPLGPIDAADAYAPGTLLAQAQDDAEAKAERKAAKKAAKGKGA